MKLKKLLNGLEQYQIKGSDEIDINHVQMDSRKITTGDIFIAIKGYDVDGHNYIDAAIKNGARAIVIEESFNKNSILNIENIEIITVPNTRVALAIIASNYYNNPSQKMKLIGVTGTKGKTTTTFMIKAILEEMGYNVGLIGTVATYIGKEKLQDNSRTTPDSLQLQEIFSKMVEKNINTVVMEVSSQSIKLDRVYGLKFDVGVFTNFSEDHISAKEHPNMEDYFNSKARLFDNCKVAFLNADDEDVMKVASMNKQCAIKTYGIKNGEFLAKNIEVNNLGAEFEVKIGDNIEKIKVPIPGRFSVYNALAAILVTESLGATAKKIKAAMQNIHVPGRSELIPNKLGLAIMIDYAHSPESLRNILEATKMYAKGRIILVFGCGGNRDAAKRPIMGKIAGELADFTVITSDNPRFEEPEKIVNQIENGMKETKGKYICIVNRVEAIKYAINMASQNDIIILAGKGHEPYQEIKGEIFPFDERKIVGEILYF